MADIYDYEPLFHKWHVGGRIGFGGFGEVYEIYKESHGIKQFAAIKRIPITKERLEEDPKLLSRVIDEIKTMERMKGANHIVIIEDFEILEWKQIEGRRRDEGSDVLIRMELLTSLESILKKGMLSYKEVVILGIHICQALENCAKYNVIHRDIKPANILKSEHGDYKLGDFGLARILVDESSLSRGVGTRGYLAPEIAFYRKYDLRVDICSLGLTMYQLLNNNKLPFQNEGEDFDIRRIYDREPIPPLGNAVPGWLAQIVIKACEYKPEDRYSHPTEMREALEAGYKKHKKNQIITKIMEIPRKTLYQKEANKLIGEHIEIPHGYTEISYRAFFERKDIINVKISGSVTVIDSFAFSSCKGLTSIEIPNSVTSIGAGAFYSCSGLTGIEIPNSVTSIGVGTFYSCSGLTSIEIPNSVTSISRWAFRSCSGLTSIEIPDSVKFIGRSVFSRCDQLTIRCSQTSYAYKYCIDNNIKVETDNNKG